MPRSWAADCERSGFTVAYLRAEGTPGDSDRYPRINVLARREGKHPGPTLHLNGHLDVVEAGQGWTTDPWAGEVRDGKVFGRGTCDMKGGIAAAVIAVEACSRPIRSCPGRSRSRAPPTRNPAATAGSRGWRGRAFSARRGSTT